MKRILCIALAVVMLTGCGGNKKPDGLSDEAYENAKIAIETVDNYTSGKKDAESSAKELYNIEIDTERLYDSEYLLSLKRNENGHLIDSLDEFPKDISVTVYISDIRSAMSSLYLDIGIESRLFLEDTIIEEKDKLEDLIEYR